MAETVKGEFVSTPDVLSLVRLCLHGLQLQQQLILFKPPALAGVWASDFLSWTKLWGRSSDIFFFFFAGAEYFWSAEAAGRMKDNVLLRH